MAFTPYRELARSVVTSTPGCLTLELGVYTSSRDSAGGRETSSACDPHVSASLYGPEEAGARAPVHPVVERSASGMNSPSVLQALT